MASFKSHGNSRACCHLTADLSSLGYERFWHSFTGFSRATGKSRNFFVEYFLCNPDSGSQKPVHSDPSSAVRPSYLMVKAGSWGEGRAQLHKFYGWKRIEVDFGIPFSISAGEMFLSDDGIRGRLEISADESKFRKDLMSDPGFMSWSLVMDRNMSVPSFLGEVVWNGELFSVRRESCNAYIEKSWGREFPKPCFWLASNRLKDIAKGKFLKSSSFAVCGETSSFFLKLEDKIMNFNFGRILPLPSTHCSCRESQKMVMFHIVHKTLISKIEIDVSCRKHDMLLNRYERTDGLQNRSRFWTGGDGAGTVKYWKFGRIVADLKVENVSCGLCKNSRYERSAKN